MAFTDAFADSSPVLIGLLMLASGLLMWRGHLRRRRSAARDVAAEVRREFQEPHRTAAGELRRMEARLYDYGREIEGRVETTLIVLDRLINEAEVEISQLESLLEQRRPETAPRTADRLPDLIGPSVEGEVGQQQSKDRSRMSDVRNPHQRPGCSPRERQMILQLAQAGYDAEEIAVLTDRWVFEIHSVLDDSAGNDQRAAA